MKPDDTEARQQEAQKLGLFALLRRIERRSPDKPRVGRSLRLRDEVAILGQDPFLTFPVSDIADHERLDGGRRRIRTNLMGYFGPQGALPLNTTEEVLRWAQIGNDRTFVAFADVFTTRFIQLFFRAWSDARAIGQFDRPDDDRFRARVAAFAGLTTPAFLDRDHLSDVSRTHLVGLHMGRVRSPIRLQQLAALHLDADIDVEEHVPTWIAFEPEDQSRMGLGGMTLGRDCKLGSRMRSVNDRIRIVVNTSTLEEYRGYLPGGSRHVVLRDLVRWYLGHWQEVTVALTLPADAIPPARLGESADLGWMAALSPHEPGPDGTAPVRVAEFDLEAA
ncbi:type VI secretion system baseplate subunit TssG [Jannaschia aquimarina]|uniref:Uncharacterized protein n=1 Tax=Jannaschia aquimarina TaxID=935700 RepID=A0A0D1DD42_9RHOB|nr:type VI secretion system baseplate subunit TssG [Jannaschia aquimarina]KIT17903.1 hypothetical protein jaqu_03280 [Jannaschia aquimarina]SNT23495.1 type VI secretion system protein ImpH [Jannaschia aquimarina]